VKQKRQHKIKQKVATKSILDGYICWNNTKQTDGNDEQEFQCPKWQSLHMNENRPVLCKEARGKNH